ncbi:MAG: fimbrial biogenesis chaperone [Novosphingobium sp.]
MPAAATLLRPLRCIAAALTAAWTLAGPVPALAQGDLLVAPTRVVLSGGGTAEVILSNIGEKSATYRIALELRRMSPEGDLDDVTEPEANVTEQAALGMVRYAPRRITLAPNQPQAVRISARPGAELPDGEYRVHMSFRAIPDPTAVEDAPASPEGGFQIRLTPIYGVTIPVIVRKGQLEATAGIANPGVVRNADGTFLSLDLTRQGARSVFGEVVVSARGIKEPVYVARGIGVYPEIGKRSLMLPLSPEQVARLKGPVRIEYREMPENGGRLIAAIDTSIG